MRISNGGFFCSRIPETGMADVLEEKLRQSGALIHRSAAGVLLGAWEELEGQGLWIGDGGAVAHDLDLTNSKDLCLSLGMGEREACLPGELIWQLYRDRGVEFFNDLRGAFAFAIWDEHRREVLVVTDHYGIRPAVFCSTGEDFLASSRIRHLLLHPEVPHDLDHDAIYQYLFFSAIPTPRTIYQAVQKLPPGRYLRWNGKGTREHTYYDIQYQPDVRTSEPEWMQRIPSAIQDAVARYVFLANPDRTGCFLSGGTDSSSVAAYYTRLSGQPAKTFSIGFDEPGYSEIHFANVAVRHFGTKQYSYFVTPEDVLALLEHLPEIYDEPFGNSSVIPAYYCARLAAGNGIDVLLAGDGGDEIFGGNERYVKNLVFANYHRIPQALRSGVLEPLIGILPGIVPFFKAKRYVRRANIPNPDRFFSYNILYEEALESVFRPDFLETLDPESFLKLARRHYAAAAPADETDRLLYLDMKLTITDNDLRKVTIMAEHAGVRVRYPLLDRDLVDFTTTIPPNLKVKPGRNRYIFKRSMEGFLPREIIEKEKHGFGLPVGPWFRDHKGLRDLLKDVLFSTDSRVADWVLPNFLASLRLGLEVNPEYYGGNLWVFLVLEMWMRKHLA